MYGEQGQARNLQETNPDAVKTEPCKNVEDKFYTKLYERKKRIHIHDAALCICQEGILALGKKKKGKLGPIMEKKVLPVVEDANKLVNYVCGSNILKEGEDIMIKPDSEYPEWLWSIRTGPPPPVSEMDPNTLEYWRRVRKIGRRKINFLSTLRRF